MFSGPKHQKPAGEDLSLSLGPDSLRVIRVIIRMNINRVIRIIRVIIRVIRVIAV